MSKVYLNPAAEREANDVGKKFMHSSDVVGDMSRAYGTDLSGVRLHTDGAAAQKAAQRGVDAFSTGGDIFFGHGAFDRNDPASQGLLAHELSHSLQQGLGEQGGVSQSAPMGAEQGGLLDFFRGLFGKKRTPAQEEWDREKQKRLDALDAEDAMAADWKRQTAEENDAVRSAHAKGITGAPKLPTYTDENTSELNLSELLGKAKELGWKKFNSQGGEDQEFNLGIMENFFREASGSSLKAVQAVRNFGCDVVGMVAIFTYGFPVAEAAFKEAKVTLTTLSNYDAVLEEAVRTDYIDESEIAVLQEWRKDPAHWNPEK